MSFLATAEALADAVAAGTYAPTTLEDCKPGIALDRAPHALRFTEFTLFAESQPDHYSRPRLLVLQPQRLHDPRTVAELEQSFRQRFVQPVIERWGAALPTRGLPAPDTWRADRIRDAIRGLAVGASRSPSDRRAATDLQTLPSLDLPDGELRARYAEWIERTSNRFLRRKLESLAALLGAQVRRPILARALTPSDLANPLADVAFPGPFQMVDSRHGLVAVCATFEQIWEPRGYTRGELVSSMGLAPGERLTLEVHIWDKSTRKSEEELSTELEMRASEKLTQRDALTVIQEYSKRRSSKASASGTIPIPKMPVKADAAVATETLDGLKRTSETLREQIVEASSALKVNRKARVEIARDSGREEKQTRLIENTNRCHSLNCHYFEVIANYVVTTRLISVQPCILLPNPKPGFTVDWVLCHEGILIESLLDRIFLPGFAAAKALKTSAVMKELETKARLAELESLGERVSVIMTAILDAYRALRSAHDAAASIVDECGHDLFCYVNNDALPVLTSDRVVAWFALEGVTHTALSKLDADVAAGRSPADALRAFMLVVTPQLLAQTPGEAAVEQRLEAFHGLSQDLRTDVLSYDDAGLRAAVGVAADAVRPIAAAVPEQDQIANLELAAARVEFERLQCHLEENWLHYTHAVWLREDHGQRFMRLQRYGTIVTAIENELLGFYGDRAAYPLREPGTIAEVDLKKILELAKAEISSAKPAPVLITMPTPGLLLEAIVGECSACEGFIEQSRVLDLRQQDAKARQEELEVARRQLRLEASPPDLSDPSAGVPAELRITLTTPDGSGPSP